jgi:hypothetical protein
VAFSESHKYIVTVQIALERLDRDNAPMVERSIAKQLKSHLAAFSQSRPVILGNFRTYHIAPLPAAEEDVISNLDPVRCVQKRDR